MDPSVCSALFLVKHRVFTAHYIHKTTEFRTFSLFFVLTMPTQTVRLVHLSISIAGLKYEANDKLMQFKWGGTH